MNAPRAGLIVCVLRIAVLWYIGMNTSGQQEADCSWH